ncbi:cupin domain-containing protein [Sagittula salina]|uniref:Cupin domain-containing protein n=1 Tax=Sagittula salina TaxID=2820268 RepID=A0A940MQ72_9RHOB|nr:cupin domain-containing protein [Sagittula salina]MBP0482708.1 cupin domain-containing protein [Sagittula salina]
MRLRADFSKREVVRPEDYDWRESPASGVGRMMLDRIGEEVARATTIVRFAPNSAFDSHTHGGGEEYLVLDGVFSDEHGDYPAGSYVRNPIGTRHRPHIGPEGATILVKLCQFAPDDTAQFAVDTRRGGFEPAGEGVEALMLHDVPGERVRLLRFAPGTAPGRQVHAGGAEIFVLEGALRDESGDYPAGTWLRLPAGEGHEPVSEAGCLLWIKTGHLARVDA